MGATNIGVIYSKAQGIIRQRIDARIEVEFTGEYTKDGQPINRRVIAAGDDSYLEHHKANILPGEVWAFVPVEIHDSFAEHERHEKLHEYLGLTGKSGVDDKHHVLDAEGNITATYLLDPEIDTPNGVFRNETLAEKHKGHRIVKAVS